MWSVSTLYPRDFVVVDRSGARHVPVCATTAPANETSEDRTVLLIGQLGGPGDRDNDELLCLDVSGTPLRVRVAAGLFAAPRGDLNPATTAPVAAAS